MNIILGTSINAIKLGLTQSELVELLGAPDKIVNIETIDEIGYIYNKIMTIFYFEKEEGGLLGSIESSNPELCLWEQKIIGMDRESIMELLHCNGVNNIEFQQYELFDILYCDDISVEFQLQFDKVQSVHIWYYFDEKDNIIWPR